MQLSPSGIVSFKMSEWSDSSGRLPHVAIIGGGPGGLFTAWHLEQLAATPVSMTIFEASSRLGGKVCTDAFATAAVRYEAGAAEFYDYSPVADDPLRELVHALGLPTVSLGGSSVFLAGRQVANLDDLGEVCGVTARDEITRFDTHARSSMTPAEFYESGSDHAAHAVPDGRFPTLLNRIRCQRARQYVEAMIHSDLAAEPGKTDCGYGLQNYLMNDPAYMRLYCIPGGNEQLMQAVATRLAAAIRLGTMVTEVAEGAQGTIRLRLEPQDQPDADGRPQVEDFDVVILALPIEALKRIRFQGPPLADAMRRHVEHHDHPAHYLRVSVLLDRPAPALPGDDAFLMLDAFGGTCLYVESARDPSATHGVLGWLLGGAAAVEMESLADEALVAAVLESLPPPLAACRDQVLEARVHRWAGAVSALPGGWSRLSVDRRHRPSPAHPQLFVVGDYLYDSTLNGVLDSAEHVAGWVVAEHAGGPDAAHLDRRGATMEVVQ
jgi:protoporphyrinogen oxidase